MIGLLVIGYWLVAGGYSWHHYLRYANSGTTNNIGENGELNCERRN
ncbi:hypothetical protein C900_03319 [Fulvivirga imtechensis AK7]|uniref:Uncharacterized protein n=1 Tax=Fulvivirga imtechensis AK7 TaxID=1237149 RepID=L8JTN7_9BACT|nr:hypothetical protein C900_03319 [Fulvivirga imtechensis AK7]